MSLSHAALLNLELKVINLALKPVREVKAAVVSTSPGRIDDRANIVTFGLKSSI